MAVDVAMKLPANALIERGHENVQYTEKRIETVANMYPGALVKRDSSAAEVEVCGTGGVCGGILGYDYCHAGFKPDTIDTIYKVNDRAPVYTGSGFTAQLRLKAGEVVTENMDIVPAANGQVRSFSSVGSGDAPSLIMGKAAMDLDNTGSSVSRLLVRVNIR
jgi:hypothetical protein